MDLDLKKIDNDGSFATIHKIQDTENYTAVDDSSNTSNNSEKTQKMKPKTSSSWLEFIKCMTAIAIPVLLETMDYTVVATSQMRIASAFNALGLQSYIGTLYLLTSTVFLPFFASLADIYGRHLALQTSLLLFLFGSALSTAAHDMAMLLVGRGVAGVGSAGLLAVVRIILADTASLSSNNRLSTAFFVLYAIGFCAGPIIGAALVLVSFRWVFAINLPACIVGMILAYLLLPGHTAPHTVIIPISSNSTDTNLIEKSKSQTHGPDPTSQHIPKLDRLLTFDWIGAALFVFGGLALLLGLNWGSEGDWVAMNVVVCLVGGSMLLVVCFIWEYTLERQRDEDLKLFLSTHPTNSVLQTPTPMTSKTSSRVIVHMFYEGWRKVYMAKPLLPPRVLLHYDVFATEFAAFTSGMVMIVIFYFLAVFMVVVNDLGAVEIGVQLIFFGPGMGAGTLLSMFLVKIFRQPKLPIVIGTGLTPIALGLIASAVHEGQQWTINAFMIIAGIGVGLTSGPLAIHARFSQPPERVAIVIALNLFFRAFGGTVGLAQCTTILSTQVSHFFGDFIASLNVEGSVDLQIDMNVDAGVFGPAEVVASNSTGSGTGPLDDPLGTVVYMSPQLLNDSRNAFREGVRWSFISLIPWCAVAFILCLFLTLIEEPKDECTREEDQKEEEEAREDGVAMWERKRCMRERLRML